MAYSKQFKTFGNFSIFLNLAVMQRLPLVHILFYQTIVAVPF